LAGAGAGVDGMAAAVTGRGWVLDGVLLTLLLLLRGPGDDCTRDGLQQTQSINTRLWWVRGWRVLVCRTEATQSINTGVKRI
jgi:hypothetical protein